MSATRGNSLKVLHVIPAVAPRYGGPSRAVFEMSRALSVGGTDVLIATTNADGPDRLNVNTGEKVSFQETDTIFFPQRLSERFTYSPELARWLRENVEVFDLVHIHAIFSHPCLAAARACQNSGVPYVVRPLGSLDPWSMGQKSWRKQALWHLSVRRMLRQAAAIHYTTNEEQRLAESTLGLDRGVVIPLGVEIEEAGRAERSSGLSQSVGIGDGPYVLALSRLHPKKNLGSLIEVFANVATGPDHLNWQLVIAGDGDDDYVARLKTSAAHDKRIVFTGWLDGPLKTEVLRNAQLVALISMQENFGLCVAEAFACGVPVIISDRVNLASDVQGANAGWVTGLLPAEIENTLRAAMSDASERERRGAAGHEFAAANLSWTKAAVELDRLYRAILTQNKNELAASSECESIGILSPSASKRST